MNVNGLASVSRAVVNLSSDNKSYNLVIEGTGLSQILRVPGINHAETKSNHILEMYEVLGVEAGRRAIIEEIKGLMKGHSIDVDSRHIGIVADRMTAKGGIHGITRFGIAKMKESALLKASFEETMTHLFQAAQEGYVDKILGVPENIIAGNPMRVGTGMFDLV